MDLVYKTAAFTTLTVVNTFIVSKIMCHFEEKKTKLVEKTHPIYNTVRFICSKYNYNSDEIVIRKADIISPYSYNDLISRKFNVVVPKWHLILAESNDQYIALEDLSLEYRDSDFFMPVLNVEHSLNKISSYLSNKNKKKSVIYEAVLEITRNDEKTTNNEVSESMDQINSQLKDLSNRLNDLNRKNMTRYKFELAHEISHHSSSIVSSWFFMYAKFFIPHKIEYNCDKKAASIFYNEAVKYFNWQINFYSLFVNVFISDKEKSSELINSHGYGYTHPSLQDRLYNVTFADSNSKKLEQIIPKTTTNNDKISENQSNNDID